MIQKEGMASFSARGLRSESAAQRHINDSVDVWRQEWLAAVPEQVVMACDELYDSTPAIPTPFALSLLLNERGVAADETGLDSAIEHWRRYRFAIDLWQFAAKFDQSAFRWLTLHPDLAKWRPLVADYLGALASDNVRRSAQLGLRAFFVDYLLECKLPIAPKELLRNGNIAPCFADACLKNLTTQEVEKRWRGVNGLIEHVLERGEEFVRVDSHGHRIRSIDYHNPLPRRTAGTGSVQEDARKRRVPAGALRDPQLAFLTELNPKLEQWRLYAVDWLASVKTNLGGAQTAIRQFFVDYIVGNRLPTDPSLLLSREWQQRNKLPMYIDTALKTFLTHHAAAQLSKTIAFLNWVLERNYSAEDDYGRLVVSSDHHNFLLDQADGGPRSQKHRTHSNKEVLPSRYIRYLRELICPEGSQYFHDLAWAQNAVPHGDWFEVRPDMIDKQDPDCVWRVREIAGKKGRKSKAKTKYVYEMWSPVRAIALMIKLELPPRTYQVRMLDSGEADTWRYKGSMLEKNHRGEWTYKAGGFVRNRGPLVSNIGKTERQAGVFRRMPDAASGKVFTGLYINTNKTRDKGKDQWDRGYVVPWQHGKVLYWCERLRDWQEKYNSTGSLVRCVSLPYKLVGTKSELQKKQMGEMSFLFRDPVADIGETAWPIADNKLGFLWERALKELENICAQKGHFAVDGSRLRFVVANERDNSACVALYSLHSLRVSLITHLATEGGVEMHILSECIAGHARILMTLYYKKSGVVYVSEAMDAASERLRDETVEQQNWVRWMKDATIKQMEVNSASVDVSVLQAVRDAVARGGVSLLRTNLGLCAKGGMGCSDGGVTLDEDSGSISYGPTPGYPQQKNCVRCRWFITGPAFLQALVHHWNLLHFNLGESGSRYLAISAEIAELESTLMDCQRLSIPFEHEVRLENLRHSSAVVYDGNEKLAADSLATMKLIVRCKHIVDAAKEHDSGVVLVAVGGMEEVTVNVRQCNELEHVLTTALGSTVYVDEDAGKTMLRAGNAFDRMLVMNGKDPIFFNLSEKELPIVVSHMTKLLQAHAGSIGRAVPFIEGVQKLSALGLFGSTDEILALSSAGTAVKLVAAEGEHVAIRSKSEHRVIPLKLASQS